MSPFYCESPVNGKRSGSRVAVNEFGSPVRTLCRALELPTNDFSL